MELLHRLAGLYVREGMPGLVRRALRRPSPRKRFVTRYITRTVPGMEIGPSHAPLASKADGYQVDIVDHLDTPDLRAKYAGHPVHVANIEPVDIVWSGGRLVDAAGKSGCYNWIVGSHVIEHMPDVVRFLQDCAQLLTPDGVLVLVVPDKRRCFDRYQAITSTGAVLDAFEAGTERPSPGRVFDHFANAVERGRSRSLAWAALRGGSFHLKHDMQGAKHMWQTARTSASYIDVHNWRFTPASFSLLIDDLRLLGLVGLEIVDSAVGPGEFYTALRHTTSAANADRVKLLSRVYANVA